MTSIAHARAWLDEQLIRYWNETGRCVVAEAIDAGLCEDEKTVMFLMHLSDGNALAASVDLPHRIDPRTFDPHTWRAAFDEQPSVLRH